MAVTNEATGTQTATIGTEHTLGGASITSAKTFCLLVDTTNMVGGTTPDILELRIKSKVLTGGAEVQVYEQSFVGLQASKQKISIPVPSLFSISFTLKQTQGTGRAFPWVIVSL